MTGSEGEQIPAASGEGAPTTGTRVVVDMDGFQVGLVTIGVRTEVGGTVLGAGPFGVLVRLDAVFAGIDEITVSPDRLRSNVASVPHRRQIPDTGRPPAPGDDA